ncbi:MAG TPA: ABC transporter permease [Candidatus Saccharimonadales bacterium]|nr:ABC transporter permease [Candidatus Saccharimonadales bacterium]
MASGITRQAMLRHRWTLIGPAITQMTGAAIIATMIAANSSISRSLTPSQLQNVDLVDLRDATIVFLGISIYMLIIIVGVTMNLAMSRQMRDIALLRSIGASPGQVRRCLARQAAIIAAPAATIGFFLSLPVCHFWLELLRAHGALPQNVTYVATPIALPIVIGICLVTSVVGTLIAVIPASRRPPNTALVRASIGNLRISATRTIIGFLLVGAGISASIVLTKTSSEHAGDAALFVILAECIGMGMVAPLCIRFVTKSLNALPSKHTLRLAVDDLDTITRSLSGALIPLILAVGFTAVKIGGFGTIMHSTHHHPAPEALWLEYSGTAVYGIFAAVAALNCLITISIARRRNLSVMQLAGARRSTLVSMAAIQTLIITGLGLAMAAIVALATLAPMMHQAAHTWVPYFSPATLTAGVGVTLGLVAAGLVLPTLMLTRKRPIAVLIAED